VVVFKDFHSKADGQHSSPRKHLHGGAGGAGPAETATASAAARTAIFMMATMGLGCNLGSWEEPQGHGGWARSSGKEIVVGIFIAHDPLPSPSHVHFTLRKAYPDVPCEAIKGRRGP
jgi:hypothetical protein